MCNSLHDDHEQRSKYFKEGKIHNNSLKDTVSVERHHKDVVTRHRQQSWYIPEVIVRKIAQDVYAVKVQGNKILDRDHTQLRPRAPDRSGRAVTFQFTPGRPPCVLIWIRYFTQPFFPGLTRLNLEGARLNR